MYTVLCLTLFFSKTRKMQRVQEGNNWIRACLRPDPKIWHHHEGEEEEEEEPYRTVYIQMHGEVSPGGGFQAGAIIATVFMLYGLAFGEDQLLSFISLDRLKIIAVIGVWMYFSVGIMGLLGIKEFLNYSDLGAKNAIMIVELGVGVAVSATMILIYLSVANV